MELSTNTSSPSPTSTPTTPTEYSSQLYRVTPELIGILQRDYLRPNDWAHSVLTQVFHMQRDTATKLLKNELSWTVSNNCIRIIP